MTRVFLQALLEDTKSHEARLNAQLHTSVLRMDLEAAEQAMALGAQVTLGAARWCP